ncbi:MAG: CHRD domain-containing protein [Acidobacteria bacterium]|nr:CHRD domain-containing protein [Acidobacteriota bacterium]
MRKLCVAVLLGLLAALSAFADTEDTVVFRTRMLSDNEVPPISAAGNSAAATITVRVTRDVRGNIDAATVMFDVDYTITSAVTFIGLHIHNAPASQNGVIVIDTGITGTNSVSAAAGTSRITRAVNYASSDANGLRFVTGLLATPENYYVNIHTTVNADGFMRGQLLPSRLILRPVMSPAFEVPAINLDAEGAALVDIQVNRDPLTGAITSGTVIFDVDYRFPSATTITGLHLNNAAAGATGPIAIDTGINGTTRAITGVTRGNVFRIAEIDSSNITGLAALSGLMNDPSRFYIELDTSTNANGLLRGQLSRNVFVFFNQMAGSEEVPVANTPAAANSMTYVRVDRDSTGNVTGGAVSFNVNYNIGSGPVTFTGLHIHNGKFGVSAGVVISSGLSTFVDDDGVGSVNLEAPVSSSNATAFDSLRGLVENPENYYVNIHTTIFPNGIVRAQLARETYRFKANMSAANEVPPATSNTSATGWITAKVSRDANGTINGGTLTFDVNFVNDGPMIFTGLHIHHPGTATQTAPAILATNLSGTNTVETTTGAGNVTRVVIVQPTSTAGLAALSALITAPDTTYVNIHSTTFPGGVARSQMLGAVNTVAQVAGGGEWSSNITIRNPSSTAAVQGIVNFFQSNGSLMPGTITDPNLAFLIPPSGSVTLSTHNKGTLSAGFARIFSNGTVTVDSRYIHPQFAPAAAAASTVTSRSVSLPVSAGGSTNRNTGVALIASSAGTLNVSLVDSAGAAISGGSRTIEVTAGQQIASFVTELLPSVTAAQYSGTLTIAASAGTLSVLALQFNGTLSPATVTALP